MKLGIVINSKFYISLYNVSIYYKSSKLKVG